MIDFEFAFNDVRVYLFLPKPRLTLWGLSQFNTGICTILRSESLTDIPNAEALTPSSVKQSKIPDQIGSPNAYEIQS